MAKVSIDVNTEDKSISVKVGKEVIDDVANVYVSTEEYAGYFMLEIVQSGDMDGLRKTTTLRASANGEWEKVDKPAPTGELSRLLLPHKSLE